MIPLVVDGTPEFDGALARLTRRGAEDLAAVEPAVRAIVADVRARGDEALLEYVERFERRRPSPLVLAPYDGEGALARLPPPLRDALAEAAARIERYHAHQRLEGFAYEEGGVRLGLRVRPLARAGVYAPGGK